MGQVVLTGKGRRWIDRGHPWIYADDVARAEAQPGELVPVLQPDEVVAGWGLFSSESRIRVRLVSRGAEQPNRAFWADRVRAAVASRAALGLLEPDGACRLLAGDADGFPGFVADRYGDTLVLQSGCQGSDRMRDFLVELLDEALPFPMRRVLDRSDSTVRKLEDLPERVEWLRGGDEDPIVVREGDLRYEVDPRAGHKTGHYLDQRDNRIQAAQLVPEGARVLDAFSYDGLFGIRAAMAGAGRVLCLEQSEAACERMARNAEANGVADRLEIRRCNAMRELRRLAHEESERFEVAVCDPPAFARSKREAQGAGRGYVELNTRALELLVPGGVLVSASCSYNVKREEFVDYLRSAARAAKREPQLLALTGASADHTHRLLLPESGYLKCAFLRCD